MKTLKFKQYQIVKVICIPSSNSIIDGCSPKIGDTGTIVEFYSNPYEAYTVEMVLPDGKTKWLVDFLPEELETV